MEETLRFLAMARWTRWQTCMLRSSLRTRPEEKFVALYVAGTSRGWCSETDGTPASCSFLTMPMFRKASGALDFPGMTEPQSAGTYVIEIEREAAILVAL